MKKNFFLSFFCLLFLTCEVPLERVNPLDGLGITCVSASIVDGENSFVVQSEIRTNEEFGVIDYGHCMLEVESIEDNVVFDSDYCRSRGALITEGEATSFVDIFDDVSINQHYKFFSYAKVTSLEGEEIIVESAKILKIINEDVPETYTCDPITGECDEVLTGTGIYDSLEDCENHCHTVEYICVSSKGDCEPVYNGDGDYDSWEDCWEKSDCEPDSTPESFDCDDTGYCYNPGDGTGEYPTESECWDKSECDPPRYDCIDGDCVKNIDGEYESMGECNIPGNCEPLSWNCNPSDGQCLIVYDGTGEYTVDGDCEKHCEPQRYDCHPLSGCFANNNGYYDSMIDCEQNCP